jgi:DnaJ-class molecular chaperone
MAATKTVVGSDKREYILVECDICGGKGTYWRDEIACYWPCHKCEGHGCLTAARSAQIVRHPYAQDIPYRPVKGVA